MFKLKAFGIMDCRKQLFVFNVWLVTNGKSFKYKYFLFLVLEDG